MISWPRHRELYLFCRNNWEWSNSCHQTAATLTFIIYCLSQNNEVVARLREEILTKVGPSRRPTYEDIKDMKFLRAVINGTRLHGIVPGAYLIFIGLQKPWGYTQLCLSISGKINIGRWHQHISDADICTCRETIHATTWPSANPLDKPIYIPANTMFVFQSCFSRSLNWVIWWLQGSVLSVSHAQTQGLMGSRWYSY